MILTLFYGDTRILTIKLSFRGYVIIDLSRVSEWKVNVPGNDKHPILRRGARPPTVEVLLCEEQLSYQSGAEKGRGKRCGSFNKIKYRESTSTLVVV